MEYNKKYRFINCGVMILLLLLMLYLNYHYYRFAYQISVVYVLLGICAVTQLRVKTKKKAVCLYLITSGILITVGIFTPKYTVTEAERMIHAASSDTSANITFMGCVSSANEGSGVFEYKNYCFETNANSDAQIIFGINSGRTMTVSGEE